MRNELTPHVTYYDTRTYIRNTSGGPTIYAGGTYVRGEGTLGGYGVGL